MEKSKLTRTIGFLGAGNMAEALIKGLRAADVVEATQIHGSDPRRERCEQGDNQLYRTRDWLPRPDAQAKAEEDGPPQHDGRGGPSGRV